MRHLFGQHRHPNRLSMFDYAAIASSCFSNGVRTGEATLETPGVVVEDVILNHFYKLFSAGKAPAIVALSLENTPKALHRAVVNALANAGHTLGHPGCDQLVMEHLGCILEAPVAVEQRVCVRIVRHRLVKGLVDQIKNLYLQTKTSL